MKSGMKQTVIGEIPDDWEVVKVGEVFQRVTRKNAESNTNALTISAQIGLVSQTEFFNKTVASSNLSGYYLLHNGDFAYNKSYSNGYPMGVIKRLDRYDKGVVSTLYICFNLVDEKSDSSFYTQYFEAGYFNDQLASIAQEGARAHGLLNVGVKDFFNLLVVKPPLPEQQKIAEILFTVDEKIAVIDEQLAQTQKLNKGLMHHLLTRGIRHDAFKDSPLGAIPEEWNVTPIGKVMELINGKAFKPSEWGNEGLPIIRIQNLNKQGAAFNYYDGSIESKYLVKNNDLLFAWSGTKGVSFGARVWNGGNAVLNQHIFRVVPDDNQLDSSFAYIVLKQAQAEIETKAHGFKSTFVHVKKSDITKMEISLPPLPEQRQIAEILTTIDDKLQVLTDKKAQYQELKRGLMQQLLTGQRRVRVAAELATVA